ncbi:Maf family protein [Patescibacteria group bacterium]|nr:Maf family protein [Patescibacteria group bacterium]
MNLSFTRSGQPEVPPPVGVILASQSIGRKFILEKLGIHFRAVIARIDEDAILAKDPVTTITLRAEGKLTEVVEHPRIYSLPEEGKTLVITADSMSVLGRKTFGKARDREDAKVILKALMGKTHTFITATAVVLLDTLKVTKRWNAVTRTKVTLRKLSPTDLETFVIRYDLSRFAGGFSLNDTPWDLVVKIDGSYTNVIGLPLEPLLPVFRSQKIIV